MTRRGLRSPGLLARRPALGLLMFLAGTLIFAALAYNLRTHGPLLAVDGAVADETHAQILPAPTWIKDILIAGFYLGREVVVGIGAVLGLYFLLQRLWRELLMVVAGFGGEGALWDALVHEFNRPRPVFTTPIWMVLHDPSFPSGHTFSAVVCYGFLAYLLVPKMPSRLGKMLVIAAALSLIVFIGFSRIYLGEHYLTDVLAGYAAGMAWAGLVYTGIELVFRKIHYPQEEDKS